MLARSPTIVDLRSSINHHGWRQAALITVLSLPLACDHSPTAPEPDRLPTHPAASILYPSPISFAPRVSFTVQPTTAQGGQPIVPAVQVYTVPSNAQVTLRLGTNPVAGRLLGTRTVTASGGVATFANLIIDRPGTGYTLIASAPNAAPVTSVSFDVHLYFGTVTAGGSHSCGLAGNGPAYCWGDNTHGQLGDSYLSGAYDATPTLVAGFYSFTMVSAGDNHTCGLIQGGAAYCWGDNTSRQLGDGGAETQSATPVPVAGSLTFRSISAGGASTCGVTTSGLAYCWGDNSFGKLGDGVGETQSATPVPVAGGHTFWR